MQIKARNRNHCRHEAAMGANGVSNGCTSDTGSERFLGWNPMGSRDAKPEEPDISMKHVSMTRNRDLRKLHEQRERQLEPLEPVAHHQKPDSK